MARSQTDRYTRRAPIPVLRGKNPLTMTSSTRATSLNSDDDSAFDDSGTTAHDENRPEAAHAASPGALPYLSSEVRRAIPQPSAREQVMLEFQRTSLQMASRFLETQQRVMLAYLGGSSSASEPRSMSTSTPFDIQQSTPRRVGQNGGLPLVRHDLEFRDEQTRGSQSTGLVQRSSIFAETEQVFSANYQHTPEATSQELEYSHQHGHHDAEIMVTPNSVTADNVSSLGFDAEKLIEELINIVSERTGYPPEMLDPTLDLEADLGIDSIKRVEILNSFRRLLPEGKRTALEDGIERLAAVKSLQGIMDWIRSDLATGVAAKSELSPSQVDMAKRAELVDEVKPTPLAEAKLPVSTDAITELRGPRLHQAIATRPTSSTADFVITMDRRLDLYLNDHTFDGVPVMPMAISVELMCEAASSLYPGWVVTSVSDMEIPAGIVFESQTKDLVVGVEVESITSTAIQLKAAVCTQGKFRRSHFKARIELAPSLVPVSSIELPIKLPQIFALPEFTQKQEPPSAIEVYKRIMFHGPLFQGISAVTGIGLNFVVGELSPKPVQEFLAQSNGDNWVIDPALLDSAMQLAGVWGRQFLDVTLLPAGFKSIRILGQLTEPRYQVLVSIPPETAGFELKCDLAVYTYSGQMVMLIEGLKGIGTKSLNRLSVKS